MIANDSKSRNDRSERISITLSFNNYAEILRFPVVPDRLEIRTGLSNSTIEVVNLGEVGIIGNKKLDTITISSFFPRYHSSYCQNTESDHPEPYEAVRKIVKWRDSKRPVRLAITGMHINMACMIEEFSYREKGGQPGDVYYDLVLKEYRFIHPRVLKKSSAGGKRPVERQNPKTYTVKKGDCLYIIAKRFYGDGKKYRELYAKNRKVIGPNPNLIRPGQVLVL